MGRKPGYSPSSATREKMRQAAQRLWQRRKNGEDFFYFRVVTNKGIFFGRVGGEVLEQAELMVKKCIGKIGLSVLSLERRWLLRNGQEKSFTLLKNGELIGGRALWEAVGRGEEYDSKIKLKYGLS